MKRQRSVRWGGTHHKRWVEITAFLGPMMAHSISHKKCTVHLESGPLLHSHPHCQCLCPAHCCWPCLQPISFWGLPSQLRTAQFFRKLRTKASVSISSHTPHLACSKSSSSGFKIHTEFNLRLSPFLVTLLILSSSGSYPDVCSSL